MPGRPLTDRELEVLRAICLDGTPPKQVAADLCLRRNTVRNHLTSAYRKLERVGAIPVRAHKKTVACVWLWAVEQAAKGTL